MTLTIWLDNAVDYIDQWLAFQMRLTRQPGCVFAAAHKGNLLFEKAYGYANLASRERLTPRHRFRVASHSKSFTAAAILKLRESGRLTLDDPAGRHVDGLHPSVAQVTLRQLLSHGGGVVRDGPDGGQWSDERPFASEDELRETLKSPLVIPCETRMKYSNHGFGLLGLVIEAVSGMPYGEWVTRNIVEPAKLSETRHDGPCERNIPFARGHSGELPMGQRVVIPADNPTNALAPATGFVSTAADLVRYFSNLDPRTRTRFLTQESRRAMVHRQWNDPHSVDSEGYGLGMCLGSMCDWPWAGHGGAFQGVRTFTAFLSDHDITFSILTNANDGLAETWSEGIIEIFKTFKCHAPPRGRTLAWSGRWWNLSEAIDLVAFRDRVLVASPDRIRPFAAADEISVAEEDRGTISLSGGYGSHGEPARLVRDPDGSLREVWLGGERLVQEDRIKEEFNRKYMA